MKTNNSLPETARKLWNRRGLILRTCAIGIAAGLIVGLGTPKEYTAGIFIVPESSRRNASSGMAALSGMVGGDGGPSSATERDAIYSALYPAIIHSTPFLVRLFDVKVREQKDGAETTLSRYLRERQKRPWWNAVTSAPSRLAGWVATLLGGTPDEVSKKGRKENGMDIFRLSPEEAGMAGAIASRIGVAVDEGGSSRRRITLTVTMQDPLVAATVADTVLAHLKEYVTDYRTAKARRMLEYAENIRREAQAEYYAAQERQTRYADANRNPAMLTSRAELVRLRNEVNLALTAYNQAELQVQVAEAKVKRMIPVLAVIQPATVPLTPSSPRKVLILAVCVLLAGAGSAAWVLFGKEFWEKTGKRKY